MARRLLPFLAAALFAALVVDLFLAWSVLGTRQVPPAFGQTASGPGTMLLGTEKAPDQASLCFVLSADPPHLLVYRVDNGGQLYLTASRDIHCDLQLEDRHIPFGGGSATSTRPPVRDVCNAVKPKGTKGEEKKDEKNAQKKAGTKAEEEGNEEGGAEDK
jgi:hypothetical protein